MRNKSLGYDQENILTIRVPRENMESKYHAIRNQFLKNSDVIGVSFSSHVPDGSLGSSPMRLKTESESTGFRTDYFQVDYDFLKTLNLALLGGRFFSPNFANDSTESVLINESAVKLLGLKEPIGKKVLYVGGAEKTIIGVVKDFHFSSLHNSIGPMALLMHFTTPSYLYIKLNKGILQDKVAGLREDWATVMPNVPIHISFLDDQINNLYFKEQNLGNMISGFTCLAVFLACLGLYGMVSFSIKNRLKEVGIRKVLGASIDKILLLLSKQYLWLIGIAVSISVPISWYVINMWLENFAYRIDISWWMFLASGIILAVIAGITISSQAIKAARESPVKVLRNE